MRPIQTGRRHGWDRSASTRRSIMCSGVAAPAGSTCGACRTVLARITTRCWHGSASDDARVAAQGRADVVNIPLHPRLRAFVFAFVCVAAAAIVRAVLDPWLGRSVPYLMYYPAVMIAASYGGFWPGVL